MKILLFGKYGQLGWELSRSLKTLGEVFAYDYPEVDFTAPTTLKATVVKVRPQIVVNAVAFTDVEKAELDTERARLINSEAPAFLAEACRKMGAAFIHYSTDYVFDGNMGRPYTEEDMPNPLDSYGHTKLAGERAVAQVGCVYLILRTAWLYSPHRENFVTKVLRWARTQDEIKLAADQVSNPTWARSLSQATANILAMATPDPISWLAERSGLFHIAGFGYTSRYEWGLHPRS